MSITSFLRSNDLENNRRTVKFFKNRDRNDEEVISIIDRHLSGGTAISYSDGTIAHSDTSAQTSSTNTDRTYIQSVELDDMGHVTSLATATETVTNTTYTSSDFDHDLLQNTHNLTTDINHNTLLNSHNLTTDIDHNNLTNYNVDEHRTISDTTVSTTGLWSSDKISTELSSQAETTYTGTAEISVGNISENDEFIDATVTEMFDALIKQEKFPILTPPSSNFTSSVTGLREVGEILDVTFSSTFNRGSINPQYTAASPYRSGLPNTYEYLGSGLTTVSKTTLSDSQTVTGYVVLMGSQSWSGRVYYDAGVQPKSSYGNDYDAPLPAGNTSYTTRSIVGVYPFYATTSGITTQTKQPLVVHTSSYFSCNMVAESGSDKQTAWFPQAFSNITGIQFYNTVSGSWEWIGGSKTNSLTTFDVTTTQILVQGNSINYDVYTHNGALAGSRQLRFYTI